MKFKDLIEEIKACEYEVKKIGDVFNSFRSGEGTITRSLKNNGDYPCVTHSDIFESQIYIDEHKTFVDLDSIKTKTFVEKGDILVSVDGYSAKKNKDGFCVYLNENKPLIGNCIYVLKHNENPKYLIYALGTDNVKKQLNLLFTNALSSILRISLKDLKKIKIPIPSLDLQEKIGSFLFGFTKYDKQLKKEMKKRQKQFHFYKEKIFEGLIEKCKLRN